MKKTVKRMLGIVFAATMLLSASVFAACEEEKKPAGRKHDQNTLVVEGTGKVQCHNFVDGKCTMCDETTIFRQDPLSKSPEILNTAQPADKQGHIEEIWYKSRAYGLEAAYPDEGEMHIIKHAYVYLPAGYDANNKDKKYNVLYMMHGNKLNEGYWFGQLNYATDRSPYTGGYGTENGIDGLYAAGKCADIIFVTPTFYSYYNKDAEGPRDYPTQYYGKVDPDYVGIDTANNHVQEYEELGIDEYWPNELKNDLMPYIAEHYNTYAKSGAPEDLIAARDHHGFTGLSRGGFVCTKVSTQAMDYISYFATESGGSGGKAFADVYNTKWKPQGYTLNYWFHGFGSSEDYQATVESFCALRDGIGATTGSNIKGGDQLEFVLSNKTGHNYATWITNLYNLLQVFFLK